MSNRLRWGILGTGNIARQFCTGVKASARGTLAAVASRSIDSARTFARDYQVPTAYGAYADVLADPAVDAVYVALPNALHHEWTLLALQAGKHVLCEKPFAVTEAQSEEMFDEAEHAGRLVMEAFMYRCHPQTHAVMNLIRGGAIGALRLIRTSFCFKIRRTEGNIRFQPDLAGGAMMDVGCYCLSLSRLIAGCEPTEVHASGRLHSSGVDQSAAGVLRFPGDRPGDEILASFACGMDVQADNTAYICGTDGYIEVPWPWKPPAQGAEHTLAQSVPPKQDMLAQGIKAAPVAPPRQVFRVDAGLDLFGVEADDFAASVLDGRPPRVSRQDTIGNIRLLERIRRQLGVGSTHVV